MFASPSLDQRKAEICQQLGIVQDYVATGYDAGFKVFSGSEIRRYKGSIAGCNTEYVISRVETGASAHALTMIQRVLDGVVTLAPDDNFAYKGETLQLLRPIPGSGAGDWTRHYQELAIMTGSAAEIEQKFQVYRDLDLITVNERPTPTGPPGLVQLDAWVCTGEVSRLSGTSYGSRVNYFPETPNVKLRCYDNIIQMAEKYGSKPALAVAKLVLDGVITEVKMHSRQLEDVHCKRISFKCGSKECQTPEFKYVFDSSNRYRMDNVYEAVAPMVLHEIRFKAEIMLQLGLLENKDITTGMSVGALHSTILEVESILSEAGQKVIQLAVDGIIKDIKLKISFTPNLGVYVNWIDFIFNGEDHSTWSRNCYADKIVSPEAMDLHYEAIMATVVGKSASLGIGDSVAEIGDSRFLSATPTPARFSFGRSRTRQGVFEIINPRDTFMMFMDQAPDGSWSESGCQSSRFELQTICDVARMNKDKNPWLKAAFRFHRSYRPDARYIILADCAVDDTSHPAVTLYGEMLKMRVEPTSSST